MERLLRLKQLFKKKPTSEEDLVQHGTQLGFAEIQVKDCPAIKSADGKINLTPEAVEQIKEEFLGDRHIGLTRSIFRGEVNARVWAVAGGLAGLAVIAGLVIIERNRNGEDLKNLLEKAGITKEDVLGKERYGVRDRLLSLLRFVRR